MNIIRFIARRIYLFFYLGRKHFLRSLFSSLGLLLSLLIVVSILGILRPLKKQLVTKLESSLPSEIVRLVPRERKSTFNPLNLFRKSRDAAIGLDKDIVDKIRKWPEVSKVYATQVLLQPALTTLEHPLLAKIGGGLSFDIMVQGVSRDMVRPFLKCMRAFKAKMPGRPEEGPPVIPFVIPETYAEILYSYATINGLPPIDIKELTGISLRVAVGQSILRTDSGVNEPIMGKVCGFVPAGIVTTVGAPIEWVEKTNKRWGLTRAARSYDQVFVQVKHPKKRPQVKRRAASLGLTIPGQGKKYVGLYTWLKRLDYIFWGAAVILLALTGIALANAFMLLSMEKKYEFGLYLVFGASPFFIWLLMFFEGAFWGAVHSTLGLYLASHLLDYAQEQLANMPMLATLVKGKWQKLSFEISAAESYYLIMGATVFAGIASMVPSILMMGRKTLALVKKD